MIINNTGTFYVEGEYAQGDTILKAGDWELRANGSKNAFAYSPETFVRRNLLDWSEDFSNSYWTKFQSSITANAITAPDGSSSADKLVENTATSDHTIFRDYIVTEDQYTLSIYAKAAERSWMYLVAGTSRAWFDLANGVVGTVDAGVNALISESADGWYRVSISVTPSASGTMRFLIRMATGNGNAAYVGNGTSGIYIWGAQLEQAATPSDYQRTTTHVPRPYAIKDELVTNGTFDTDLSGWTVSFSAFWENGTLVLPRGLGVSTNAEISQVVTNLRVGCEYEVTLDIVEQIGLALHLYPFGRYVSPTYVFLGGVGTSRSVRFTANAVNMTLWLIAQGNSGDGFRVVVDNVSIKEVQQPITLGNGNHKDFRYYPKTLSQNETEALTA